MPARTFPRTRLLPVVFSACLLLSATSATQAQTYTSRSAFITALPGPATTVNFDTLSAGTTFASGTSTGGLTFTYDFGGVLLKVNGTFPAPSPAHSLGSTDADVLQDGDNLTLTFAGRNAIGLSIITAETLQAGDLSLTAGGITATLAPAVQQTLSDGAKVYFLGVIKPTAPFTSATLTTVGGGFFFYNLDDVTLALAADADGDGTPDAADNCTLLSNPSQVDSDSDGYGNRCDGDLNNNGATNSQDYILFRNQIGQPSSAPTYNAADFNSNGVVNSQDYILFRQLLGSPPGPSGLHP